ncbi:MAG: hypothetical protein J5892_02120 [Bacilli bacterium]|nr:hypothetical protein [Bacilli bacterium]
MAKHNQFDKIVRINEKHFALNYHIYFHNDISIVYKYDNVDPFYNYGQNFKYFPRFIKFFSNCNNDEVIECEIFPEGSHFLLNYHLDELYERFRALNSKYKNQNSDMVLIPGVSPCGTLIITRKEKQVDRKELAYTKTYYDFYNDNKAIDVASLKYVYYLTYVPQFKQKFDLSDNTSLKASMIITDDTNLINFDALSIDRARIVNDCFSKLIINEYINTDVKKRKLLLGKL